MCGIAGAIDLNQPLKETNLDIDALYKRGPDDRGVFQDKHVFLGHRRLSIIDLTTGHQPMFSNDGSVVIVFNGEIYNFKSIRTELQLKGHSFLTSSDTEVIIQGYLEFGIDGILGRLEGMFAFSLYDIQKRKVYIARDRFGEKPLYYSNADTTFFFSSELKALSLALKSDKLDFYAINLFLSLSYIPAPYTIYASIRKLSAGSYVELQEGGQMQIKEYYNLQENLKNKERITNYDKAKAELKELVFKSVEQRMISDVPIGAFLSGGIDSSIISSVMANLHTQPINTFSIGFNEPSYDESKRAELVAKQIGSNHEVFFLDFDDAFNMIDEITSYFDEPFGDSSSLASYFVAKMAASKVKVVLTGDAADELFGGYEKYLAPYYSGKYNRIPGPLKSVFKNLLALIPHNRYTNNSLRKFKKVISNAELDPFSLHYSLMCLGFSDDERNSLLSKDFIVDSRSFVKKNYDDYYRSSESMQKGFYTDLKIVLEGDMLPKVDRMCMMNSLEARVPFLDSEIVEFSYRLPTEFKIQGTNKKRILKDSFADMLPKETLSFSKKGFGVPVNLWMRNQLKGELTTFTNSDFLRDQGIFNADYIHGILNEHFNGIQNHTSKLWNLFIFQKWYVNNLGKN